MENSSVETEQDIFMLDDEMQTMAKAYYQLQQFPKAKMYLKNAVFNKKKSNRKVI